MATSFVIKYLNHIKFVALPQKFLEPYWLFDNNYLIYFSDKYLCLGQALHRFSSEFLGEPLNQLSFSIL